MGNLQKYVATGAASRTFEIGDASNYTPVSVSFGNVTVAGNLTAKTTTGEHPNSGTLPRQSEQEREPLLDPDQQRHHLHQLQRDL